MKKYLSVLLVGLFTCAGAFASADTVDGFTSESQVCVKSFTNAYYPGFVDYDECPLSDDGFYYCVASDDTPFYSNYTDTIYVENSPACVSTMQTWDGDSEVSFYSDYDNGVLNNFKSISGKIYYSNTLITPPSLSNNDNSGITIPGISGSSFASGIINGVNAMIGGFGTWIPKLMLYGLPILVVVIFWRKIWSFIKRIFKRR